jgi:hypothetical protein
VLKFKKDTIKDIIIHFNSEKQKIKEITLKDNPNLTDKLANNKQQT